MKSKIIKVSIVLIFMMFSVCLFNFCFALSLGTDFEIIDTITMPNEKNLYFVKSNLDYELPNFDNIIVGNGENIEINDFIKAYNNNGYTLSYSKHNSDYRLELLVPSVPNTVLSYHYIDNSFAFRFVQYGDMTYTNTAQYMAYYNFDTATWKLFGPYTNYGYGLENYNYTIDCQIPIYNDKWDDGDIVYVPDSMKPHIDIKVTQTGVRTGHVEFISKNWDGHMYYIKDDMDRLDSLVSNGNISKNDSNLNYYSGPIYIEENEYVLGLIFDDDGNVIFSKISETIEYDPDFIFNDSHCLRLEQDDMDTYYLFIHSPQERRLYKSI